jgi:hypothetical protein
MSSTLPITHRTQRTTVPANHVLFLLDHVGLRAVALEHALPCVHLVLIAVRAEVQRFRNSGSRWGGRAGTVASLASCVAVVPGSPRSHTDTISEHKFEM